MHFLRLLALGTAGAAITSPALADPPPPTAIDYAMYFHADVRDAPACAMTVEDGAVTVAAGISNPAMSCPDMFSWKLFAEAVSGEFWANWAADQQTWPAEPLKMCETGTTGTDCCAPGNASNPGYDNAENPARHCPYFPGDHATSQTPLRQGQPLSKAHDLHLDLVHRSPAAADAAQMDPGRVIRQSMAEFVFRNKPLFDYVFENDLYNQEGLAKVFANNAASMASAPYQSANTTTQTRIEFPVESVMIKSDWISKERAEELGIAEDPASPFIKMVVESAVTDNNGTIFLPGEHWLMAMHFSSKDLPNWIWTTFEHVSNPGRCDYTGCNDSYGFASPDTLPEGAADNFTRPNVVTDDLPIASPIFDPGQQYAGGEIRSGLEAVLSGLGIGTTASSDPSMPTPADSAWLSYRLKGSQTEFTTAMGRPTILGNSVTEGGFVSSSSCISCHARAHVGSDGFPSVLGVFENNVDPFGYPKSVNGVPNPNWYLSSQQPPALQALQTDFVWGFFFANKLTTKQ
jgi:hypothetical protein